MHFELERTVGEESNEVCLGGDFQRHEIEYGDAKRTNILCVGAFVAQDEDVLVLEEFDGREPVW
jgi:hypothetical protein